MKELIDRGSSGEYGWHGLSAYLRCLRFGRLAEEEARTEEKDYHVRGNMLHVGLAHLYARRMQDGADRFLTPASAIEEMAERHKRESVHYMAWKDRVIEALRAYVQNYGPEPELEVLGVEEVVRAKVLDPNTGQVFPYSLRYDLLVRDRRTKKVIAYDHKGTYAILKRVTSTYDLDGQMLGIARVMRAQYGADFDGVAMNFVRMSQPKSPAVFEFARTRPANTPKAVLDIQNTIKLAHKLRNVAKAYPDALDVPGVYNDACWNKYGPCQFRELCSFGRR